MKSKVLCSFTALMMMLAGSTAAAAALPGVPRDSNFGNTDGYDSTRIEARLVVPVKESTKVVHFIRDNNDPRVITKTYHIKNVDAYLFRDYLRQMVQAKRVGNTSLQQLYPGNTSGSDPVATASSAGLSSVNTQPGYNPAAQLGSNTAVECLKYVDGTGLLLISAEDYRFKDHPNGMGFDSLVKFLDKPQMGAFFGTQTFFYVPKYVPARNLMPLIENVGMNIMDVTEVWQGMDLVAYDPDLNWLVFDVVNFSMYNIETMLKKYDVPIPQVRLKFKVYEIYSENDDKLGIDFQAWKNNEGMDFFSAGGRYRDNWSTAYNGGLLRSGSERTSFYHFNPKWNTRYLDFMVSKGKANIAYTGELCIRNNTPASISRRTQIFYFDTQTPAADGTSTPDLGAGVYELLSSLADRIIASGDDYPVGKANQQKVLQSGGFGFDMDITNASVNLDETSFQITLSNSSLIGFESNGKPRISRNNAVTQTVSLPHGVGSFVIGGLKKQETVKSKTGIPWLMNIPYLGYLFSTESNSVKYAELVLMAECEWDAPP